MYVLVFALFTRVCEDTIYYLRSPATLTHLNVITFSLYLRNSRSPRVEVACCYVSVIVIVRACSKKIVLHIVTPWTVLAYLIN